MKSKRLRAKEVIIAERTRNHFGYITVARQADALDGASTIASTWGGSHR